MAIETGRHLIPSSKFLFFLYFFLLCSLGSVFLYQDFAWSGGEKLPFIDAIFTSVSAVCVTGLITVDTAQYTTAGKIIIALLIQFGGLGFITFSTLYLGRQRAKISFANRRIIRDYYLDSVQYDPRTITKNIIIFTLVAEAIGVLALIPIFSSAGIENPGFVAIFHAISAFCNAGFSTFTNSLEQFDGKFGVSVVVMLLIFTGGIGFVVIDDLMKRMRNRRHRVSLHTKIVLTTTAFLILGGAAAFYFFERELLLKGYTLREAVVSAVFQAVTPRTAGFNTLVQADLSLPSKFFTMFLMLIGGAPGSIAGGMKVTTFAILFLAVVKIVNREGEIRIGKRKIPRSNIIGAHLLFTKILGFMAVTVLVLSLTEGAILEGGVGLLEILFEVISAFGTVGLSLGITSGLSLAGKIVLICTMFTGRVGLLAMAGAIQDEYEEYGNLVDYPDEEVLIG